MIGLVTSRARLPWLLAISLLVLGIGLAELLS